MKLLGIGSELCGGVVVSITNSKTNGILVFAKDKQGKTVKWSREDVESFVFATIK